MKIGPEKIKVPPLWQILFRSWLRLRPIVKHFQFLLKWKRGVKKIIFISMVFKLVTKENYSNLKKFINGDFLMKLNEMRLRHCHTSFQLPGPVRVSCLHWRSSPGWRPSSRSCRPCGSRSSSSPPLSGVNRTIEFSSSCWG